MKLIIAPPLLVLLSTKTNVSHAKSKNPFWNTAWTAFSKNTPLRAPRAVPELIVSSNPGKMLRVSAQGPQRTDFEDKNVVAN